MKAGIASGLIIIVATVILAAFGPPPKWEWDPIPDLCEEVEYHFHRGVWYWKITPWKPLIREGDRRFQKKIDDAWVWIWGDKHGVDVTCPDDDCVWYPLDDDDKLLDVVDALDEWNEEQGRMRPIKRRLRPRMDRNDDGRPVELK